MCADTKHPAEPVPVKEKALAEYRASIDTVDTALIALLIERFRLTNKVGRYKAEAGLAAEDRSREAQQLARYRDLAVAHHADGDADAICELMQHLMLLVKGRHNEMREQNTGGQPLDYPTPRHATADKQEP